MAEESQNLVHAEMPEEDGITVDNREPRSNTMTCNRRGVLPALSIFVALLIAGQAVSVYFITQQQSKISELDATTKQLKLQDMIKKLPGSPPSDKKPKMRMATFNIPMAFTDDDGSLQKLEDMARNSDNVQDAARYMLLMTNPLRKYPSFNGTILENLRKLRKTLNYQEWMQFDAWMQQWFLFYLVQNTKMPETTPAPKVDEATGTSVPKARKLLPVAFEASRNMVYASTSYSTDSVPSLFDETNETPSGVPVLTQCQMQSQTHALPGAFRPQCDANGDFTPIQCWRSTGYCWCVYKNGTEIPDTRSRARIDCTDIGEFNPQVEMYD